MGGRFGKGPQPDIGLGSKTLLDGLGTAKGLFPAITALVQRLRGGKLEPVGIGAKSELDNRARRQKEQVKEIADNARALKQFTQQAEIARDLMAEANTAERLSETLGDLRKTATPLVERFNVLTDGLTSFASMLQADRNAAASLLRNMQAMDGKTGVYNQRRQRLSQDLNSAASAMLDNERQTTAKLQDFSATLAEITNSADAIKNAFPGLSDVVDSLVAKGSVFLSDMTKSTTATREYAELVKRVVAKQRTPGSAQSPFAALGAELGKDVLADLAKLAQDADSVRLPDVLDDVSKIVMTMITGTATRVKELNATFQKLRRRLEILVNSTDVYVPRRARDPRGLTGLAASSKLAVQKDFEVENAAIAEKLVAARAQALERLKTLQAHEENLVRVTAKLTNTMADMSGAERAAGEGNADLADAFKKYKINTERATAITGGLAEVSKDVSDALSGYGQQLQAAGTASKEFAQLVKDEVAARKSRRELRLAQASIPPAGTLSGVEAAKIVSPQQIEILVKRLFRTIAQAGLRGLPPQVAGTNVKPETGILGENALLKKGFLPEGGSRFSESDRIREITANLAKLVAEGKDAGDVLQAFFEEVIRHENSADIFEIMVSGAIKLTDSIKTSQGFGKALVATFGAMTPRIAKILTMFAALRDFGSKSATGVVKVLSPIIGNIDELAKTEGKQFAEDLRNAVTREMAQGILLRENGEQMAQRLFAGVQRVIAASGKKMSLSAIFERNIGAVADQLNSNTGAIAELQQALENGVDVGPALAGKMKNVLLPMLRAFGKMTPELAKSLRNGDHGEIGKAFLVIIDEMLKMGTFHSLPDTGPIREMGQSFALMGGTFGEQIVAGANDLHQSVTEFFQLGLYDIGETVTRLMGAPFRFSAALIYRTMGSLVNTTQAAVQKIGAILERTPLFGRLFGFAAALSNSLLSVVGGVANVITGVVTTVLRLLGSIVETSIRTLGKLKDSLVDTAQQILALSGDARRAGVDISRFDIARRAVEKFDVSASDLSQTFQTLRQNIIDAGREGNTQFSGAIAALGVSFEDLQNLDPVDLLLRASQALQGLRKDSVEYLQVLDLLGAQNSNMRQVLEDVEALRKNLTLASSEGIISQEDADRAREFMAVIQRTRRFIEDVKVAVFSAFNPLFVALSKLTEGVGRLILRDIVGGLRGIGNVVGKVFERIGEFLLNSMAKRGIRGLWEDAKTIGRTAWALIQAGIGRLTTLAIDAGGKVVDHIAKYVLPVVAELSKKILPLLIAAMAAALAGALKLGIDLARGVTKFFGGTADEDFAQQQLGTEVDETIDALVEKLGLLDFSLDKVRAKFKGMGRDGESFMDIVRKESPELAKIIGSAGKEIEGVVEQMMAAMSDSLLSGAARENAVRDIVKRLKEMQREYVLSAAATVDLIRRNTELAEAVSQASQAFSIGGAAASDNRRAIAAQLDGMQQLSQRIAAQLASYQNTLAGALQQQGINPAQALSRATEAVQKHFGNLQLDIADLIQDGIRSGFDSPELDLIAKNLQDRIEVAVQKFAEEFQLPSTVFGLGIDVQNMVASMRHTLGGVQHDALALADAAQRIQDLTQGFSLALVDAGTNSAVVESQFKTFAAIVDAAFAKLDRLAKLRKESGFTEANSRAYALQKKIVEQLARGLGIHEATRDAIIAQARALSDLAIKANAAGAAFNRFTNARSIIDSLGSNLGALSDLISSGPLSEIADKLALDKVSAELEQVLQNSKDLVPVFEKWFNVSGTQEEVVAKITKRLQEMLAAAREIQKLQARVDSFTKLDDIFKSARDSNPYESLKDGVLTARAEATRLALQMNVIARENEETLTHLVRTAPARLVQLARDLEASGALNFKVQLDEEHAEQIAAEIGRTMHQAIKEQLDNIRVRPLVERIRESLSLPLVSGITETLRGIADGTIFEAARTARTEAKAVGEKFSTVLFTLSKLGQSIFTKALDSFISRITDRLTDVLTKSIVDGLLSSQVFGAISQISERMREAIGLTASGIVAAFGLVLSRLQSTASAVKDDIDSVVQSTEAVRGVISGDTTVALKEVGAQLEEALGGTEARLDKIIGVLMQYRTGTLGLPVQPLASSMLTGI